MGLQIREGSAVGLDCHVRCGAIDALCRGQLSIECRAESTRMAPLTTTPC